MARRAPLFCARSILIAGLLTSCVYGDDPHPSGGHVRSIEVRTTPELLAALAPADVAVREIHLAAGRYALDRPLVVPDGTTLVGAGTMQYAADGTPAGFANGTESAIVAATPFEGDLVTLGNATTLRRLALRDRGGADTSRSGNVVAIGSRTPHDAITATIDACEIDTPNSLGIGVTGPTGNAVIVLTRNPSLAGDPFPHEASTLDVEITGSVLRSSATGGALFVVNFAARTDTRVRLARNRVEGALVASGGVNRPDPVDHSTVSIASQRNLYVAPPGDAGYPAWVLLGASSPPHMSTTATIGPSSNRLRAASIGDRIDGFATGIFGAAARRFESGSGPLYDNSLEIDLSELRLHTVGPGAADFAIYAAQAASPDATLPVGERNVVRVRMRAVDGSGARANEYAERKPVGSNASNSTDGRNKADTNRIEFVGNASEFRHVNANVDPPPAPDRFVER